MKKHFLVTVSNDINNLFGVQFICSFFKKSSQHQITLLHISRLDGAETEHSLLEMWSHPDERVRGQLTVGAKRSIDKSMAMLSESRMSVDQIVVKTVAERYGKVKDILTEGSTGLYDAIILGRRASYTLQWVFEKPGDETHQTIIKDSCFTTPIWVCPEQEQGRKDVLVCVDGSDNAFRAVDHAAFIVSRQDQHAIALFHVESSNGQNVDEIFSRATKILHDHHISDNRISCKSTWGLSIPGTIQNEIAKNHYGAVALGLRGLNRGFLKDLKLAGGTTAKLINKLEKTSIWCCP
ncbi:MAG: universal stress protein [Desulforhopalus sp.]